MKFINLSLLLITLTTSITAKAGLIDRGNGMIYDDVLDITWLQDANYMSTSGYAETNKHGHSFTIDHILPNGTTSWNPAFLWADSLVYMGYNDWRLPTVVRGGNDGWIESSELLHMFQVNLGNKCKLYDCSSEETNTNFVDAINGKLTSFYNIEEHIEGYWTGTKYTHSYEYDVDSGGFIITAVHDIKEAFYYDKPNSSVGVSIMKNSLGSWAVRDGDVAQVPEPSTLAIFALGMIGLASRRFKKH